MAKLSKELVKAKAELDSKVMARKEEEAAKQTTLKAIADVRLLPVCSSLHASLRHFSP